MFTKTFTIERHIEELRAELRTVTDAGSSTVRKAARKPASKNAHETRTLMKARRCCGR